MHEVNFSQMFSKCWHKVQKKQNPKWENRLGAQIKSYIAFSFFGNSGNFG